jgi:hypothetical protein
LRSTTIRVRPEGRATDAAQRAATRLTLWVFA